MTPEEQQVQDKLPSLQYRIICGPAFERNTIDHKAMVEKLDLIIERQAEVKADLATTKDVANEVYSSLIMGNGDSVITQVRLQGEAIETLQSKSAKTSNRWWRMVELLVAATLPLIILWLTRKL